MKEFRDTAVLKLCSFMLSFVDDNNGMYVVKPLEDKRLYIAVAYNSEGEYYRFAGVSAKNSTISPIYYYDIYKKTLGNSSKSEIYEYLDLALIGPPIEFERDLSTEENIKEVLLELVERKTRPSRYVYSIFNVLMYEIMNYFGNKPCFNGHTVEMEVGQYTNEIYGVHVLSIIEDKHGDFKNIDNTELLKIETLEEKESYIKEHYEELIKNIV